MHILAVASQKGGSGKTTLAGHLAVQAELAGDGPVALIDTDPQGSLSDWWRERGGDRPLLARTKLAKLSGELRKLRSMGIRLLIVDTPPAITSTISRVIDAADLVVIPTRASPHDLRAVGATVELAERMAKPLLFVINGSTPRTRITAEAVVALGQHGPLAPTIVHQRTDFAVSMIDGRTVMEMKGRSRSPEEMVDLWQYVKRRIAMASAGGADQRGTQNGQAAGPSPVRTTEPAARKTADSPAQAGNDAPTTKRSTQSAVKSAPTTKRSTKSAVRSAPTAKRSTKSAVTSAPTTKRSTKSAVRSAPTTKRSTQPKPKPATRRADGGAVKLRKVS